jgi:hypothetical protein
MYAVLGMRRTQTFESGEFGWGSGPSSIIFSHFVNESRINPNQGVSQLTMIGLHKIK